MQRSVRMKAHDRAGFTLIEVMVALGIFAGALLSLAAFSGRFAHAVSEGTARTTAVELAAERIETVKSGTKYALLESQFAGTESSIVGATGFSRQTLITRVGGSPSDLVDYKIVTVIVSSDALKTPIRKTSIISEF